MERKTTFLAATSPQSEDTYFSYLCQVKNPRTGAKIFNVVYLVQVCKQCRNSGKALECLHKRDKMSTNKNAATMEDSLLFFRPGVERQVAARENQGEVTSNKGLLISRALVDNWKSLRVSVRIPPRVIYLSVDTGGGSVGHMGVAAHIEQKDHDRGLVQLVVGFFFFYLLCLSISSWSWLALDRLFLGQRRVVLDLKGLKFGHASIDPGRAKTLDHAGNSIVNRLSAFDFEGISTAKSYVGPVVADKLLLGRVLLEGDLFEIVKKGKGKEDLISLRKSLCPTAISLEQISHIDQASAKLLDVGEFQDLLAQIDSGSLEFLFFLLDALLSTPKIIQQRF